MNEEDLIKAIDNALEQFNNDKVIVTYCYKNCKNKCYKHISNKKEGE